MKVRGYSGGIAGVFCAGILFIAASLPLTASASTALDIAKAIYSVSNWQTTICNNNTNCINFANSTTETQALSTFSSLNSTSLTSIFNSSSINYLVPTLDANILSSLNTNTLSNTLQNLAPSVLQSFTSTSLSQLNTTTLTDLLGGSLSSTVLGNIGGDLLSSYSGSTLTTILGGVSGTNLSTLPSTLFGSFDSTQLSSILSSPTLVSSLTQNLLPSIGDTTIISDAINQLSSSVISALPGDLLGSLSDVSSISSILDGLSQTSLNSLTSEFFSSFSTETMTELLSTMSTDLMNQIGGELLSGFTSTDLASIFNGMDLTALGDLGNIFTSLDLSTFSDLLGTESITGLLSGDVIGSITSMFSGVDSGIISGALDALGAGGLEALGGDVVSSLMGSVSGPVMDAVMGAVGGDVMSAITSLTGISIPGLGGFGLFVPVNDKQLNSAFSKYSSAFNSYASNMNSILKSSPDSIRDIIAGDNPKGVAEKECHKRDAHDLAFAYEDGPWAWAVASSSAAGLSAMPLAIPGEGEYVKIIGAGEGGESGDGTDSGSIRCILTALVGYQKIALFAQIQSLLKQYISDAQQQQLSNQLLNKINAANLSWASEGVKVNNPTGASTAESVYVQDSTQSQFARNERTADTIISQAASPVGGPAGSLELCNPLDTAAAVAINLRDETEDERGYIAEVTRCSRPAETVTVAMDYPNSDTADGAFFEFGNMMKNFQDSKLGQSSLVYAEGSRRVEQDRQRVARAQSDGFQPTSECSGAEGDPFCDPAFTRDTTSAAQNRETVVSAVESGKEQVSDSNNLDSSSVNPAENLSTEANTQTGGVAAYNPSALASSTPPIHTLIHELYDTIQIGYFDLDKDQENWASAALLNIYDMMRFDKGDPTTAVDRGTGTQEGQVGDEAGGTVYFD